MNKKIIEYDLKEYLPGDLTPKFKMEGKNKKGDWIKVNRRYIEINGKPFLPVMGEAHFSRIPTEFWEEIILKMKSVGITIISTYIFWIYHEEEKGKFNWEGQRNLRKFIQLIKKHDLYCLMRIGPFCHGEVRNGGVPDWWWDRSGKRSTNEEWLRDTKILYSEIYKQVKDLLFKDDGPIIGIQLENEYDNGIKGLPYIQALKRIAIEVGFDLPIYTVTGWGKQATIPLYEVLPVFGHYSAMPWDISYTPFTPEKASSSFFFMTNSISGYIEVINVEDKKEKEENKEKKRFKRNNNENNIDFNEFPLLTCEIGSGNQMTYHRRPLLSADDIVPLVYTKLGVGVNLIGYYMFYGGTNLKGKKGYLNETFGRPSMIDYPYFSYDFQAPIREFGQEHETYRLYKELHYFINTFSDLLAPMSYRYPLELPKNMRDCDTPRSVIRTDGTTAFVFVNNHDRYNKNMHDIENVQFKIRLEKEEIIFPQKPFTIKKDAYFIWPINLKLEQTNTIKKIDEIDTIDEIDAINTSNSENQFNNSNKIKNNKINLLKKEKESTTLRLKYATAQIFLKTKKEYFLISKKNMPIELSIAFNKKEKIKIDTEITENNKNINGKQNYKKMIIEEEDIINNIFFFNPEMLKIDYNTKILIKKQNDKENEIEQENKIMIYLLDEEKAKDIWIIDNFIPSRKKMINLIVITKANLTWKISENTIDSNSDLNDQYILKLSSRKTEDFSISFLKNNPFVRNLRRIYLLPKNNEDENKGRMIIEEKDDTTRLDYRSFSIPIKTRKYSINYKEIGNGIRGKRWKIKIDDKAIQDLIKNKINDLFIRINFVGNQIYLYFDDEFIWDNYYNGEILEIGLKRWKSQFENKELDIFIEISELEKDDDIFFDVKPKFPDGKYEINEIIAMEIVPEYAAIIKL